MYSVCVRDHFMIAHSFKGEVFGPAQQLHGATYVVDVEFRRSTLDDDGVVVWETGAINLYLTYYLFAHPTLVSTVDDVIRYSDIIFTPDEMSMLGGIIGFWFGSRNWNKK